MQGLIDQLQQDALNQEVPVSTLLRKVKVAAVKLGLNDALEWVERELGGYKTNIPDYRKGQGTPEGYNPYHGWQPIQFGHGDLANIIGEVTFFEPIASYEALLAGGAGTLRLEHSADLVAIINETLNVQVPRIANTVTRGQIVRIVQKVRDLVLDWALELARAGVTGDGLSFTADERDKASGAQISIGTFHGSFNSGDAVGANPRINLGSTDTSTNTTVQGSLFGRIEQAVRSEVSHVGEREAILAANTDMQAASDHKSLLAAYSRFIAAAANHMTVIGPFLPALGAMLVGH